MIELKLACAEDAPEIHAMQLRAFMPLYEKYRDDETTPALENVERVLGRIADPATKYFYIDADGQHAGAIRVQQFADACRISPIFILPEYQGRGIAQQAMKLAEAGFPHARKWVLDTILEEKGNCHLYEKLGYVRVGQPKPVNERMTLVDYVKRMEE